MTRFFLTLPQAIALLFQAVEIGVGGETYVMNMPSFYIRDLLEVLIEYYGNGTEIIETGAREGEKIHEILISENEISRSEFVNDDYYVIHPQIAFGREYKHYGNGHKIPEHGLTSRDNLHDRDYLKELLKLGGWLL